MLRTLIALAISVLVVVSQVQAQEESQRSVFLFPAEKYADPSVYAFAEWSPDGTQAVYVCGVTETLCLVNEEENLNPILTDSFTNVTDPVWSPDGKRIAFSARFKDNDGNSIVELYELFLDTWQTRYLTNTPNRHEFGASYSPDMKYLVLTSVNPTNVWDTDLVVLNLETLAMIALTHTHDINEIHPAWSPDGSHVAFSANIEACDFNSDNCQDMPQFDIYTIDVNSLEMTRLTDDSGFEFNPRWYADGSMLVYESHAEGQNIYLLYMDTKESVAVTACESNVCGMILARWKGSELIVNTFGQIDGVSSAFNRVWKIDVFPQQ